MSLWVRRFLYNNFNNDALILPPLVVGVTVVVYYPLAAMRLYSTNI